MIETDRIDIDTIAPGCIPGVSIGSYFKEGERMGSLFGLV